MPARKEATPAVVREDNSLRRKTTSKAEEPSGSTGGSFLDIESVSATVQGLDCRSGGHGGVKKQCEETSDGKSGHRADLRPV